MWSRIVRFLVYSQQIVPVNGEVVLGGEDSLLLTFGSKLEAENKPVWNFYRIECSYNRRGICLSAFQCMMIFANTCYHVYCVRVCPYPRCGSDRLPAL